MLQWIVKETITAVVSIRIVHTSPIRSKAYGKPLVRETGIYSRLRHPTTKEAIPTWISSSGVVPGMINGPPIEGNEEAFCLCAFA